MLTLTNIQIYIIESKYDGGKLFDMSVNLLNEYKKISRT